MPSTAASRGGHGCTICADPNVEAIDAAIKSGALSRARIAAQYNVSESAVQRHKDRGHVRVDATVSEAPEIRPSGTAIDVPQEMLAQFERTLEAVKLAREQGNLNSIADANREHRLTLEAISKWNIEQQKVEALKAPPQVIRLASSAEWQHLRATVSDFFSANPSLVDVRLALTDALNGVENASPEAHQAWWERRKAGRQAWTPSPRKEAHEKPTTDDARTPGRARRSAQARSVQQQAEAGADAGTGRYTDPIEAI